MTRLKSIAGRLIRREPGVSMISKEKVLYIEYSKLVQPVRISGRDIPCQQLDVVKYFKERVTGYGIPLEDLNQWTLYIDARDDYWMPHLQIPIVMEALYSLFGPKNICILSNSIYDASHLEHNVEFYSTAAANLYNYYDELYEQKIDWDRVTLDKHFIALARRPTLRRVQFVKSLLDEFGNDLRASCGTRIHGARHTILVTYPKEVKEKPAEVNLIERPVSKVLPVKETKLSYEEIMHPYPYPLTIDEGVIDDKKQHQNFDDRFFSAMVNIVCETLDDDADPVNLSEKTFKSFAWRQIPIWHASPGTVAEVKYLGFDLFSDIIDHSYDSITDYDERKEAVLNSLHSFKRQFPTLADLTKLRQAIRERLEFNDRLLQEIIRLNRPLLQENLFK